MLSKTPIFPFADSQGFVLDMLQVQSAGQAGKTVLYFSIPPSFLINFQTETLPKRYLMVISSWQKDLPSCLPILNTRKASRLIYTTNTIEGYRRQIRKVTKNKGVFASDMSLLKLIYLETELIARKWTSCLQNWSVSASQLKIIFGDRMKTDL